ncbi:hypothetical protein I4F81_002198 [Pyropia yezoensis]|uniref:Uncharacterized protein n=1 Tax=Pyropia yezoensis TaxID=2788 RepID=A0ACC3BPQ7_PYRYE|nr:hypothetical protein I4F81_002198 [Neopyropia yezoensis]
MVWRWAAARAAGHRSTSASAAPMSLRKSHRQTAASARKGAAMLRWPRLPRRGTAVGARRGRSGGGGAGKGGGEATCAASAGCAVPACQRPALPLSANPSSPPPRTPTSRQPGSAAAVRNRTDPTRWPPRPRTRPQAAARAREVAAPPVAHHAHAGWPRGRGVGCHHLGKRRSSATTLALPPRPPRGGWRVAVTRS